MYDKIEIQQGDNSYFIQIEGEIILGSSKYGQWILTAVAHDENNSYDVEWLLRDFDFRRPTKVKIK